MRIVNSPAHGAARARAVLLATSALVCVAVAGPAAAKGYEAPPTFSAREILTPALLSSDAHTVQDAVRNDGVLNNYVITTSYGEMTAQGNELLAVRVQEAAALKAFDELSKTEVFLKGAKDAGVGKIKAVGKLVTAPITTLKSIPEGVGRLFTRTKDTVDSSREAISGDTDDGRPCGTAEKINLANEFLGVSAAQRKWSAKLSIDPYTTNTMLREALKQTARVDTAARLTVAIASPIKIPGSAYIGRTHDLVWTQHPADLKKLNGDKLKELGIAPGTIEQFQDQLCLTPTLRTRIVTALGDMAGVTGLQIVVDQSLDMRSEAEARFLVRAVEMAARYHQAGTPVKEFVPGARFPLFVTRDGQLTVILPTDYVAWTEVVARGVDVLTQAGKVQSAKSRHFMLEGAISPRAKAEIGKTGWRISDNWVPPGTL